MVFYQAVLLAGYAYAHYLTKIPHIRWQLAVHLALLIVPIAILPIRLPHDAAPPTTMTPIFWLLATLTTSVGLPFFLVTTSSPLLQRWFSLMNHRNAADPYFLYSASNAGSLFALLGYPFLWESNLTLLQQSLLWTWGYGVLLILFIMIAMILWREPDAASRANGNARAKMGTSDIAMRSRLYWVFLAFVPSSMMLGVTTYFSTDIAAAPLLWVIPLSLYLLSFILVFSNWFTLPYAFIVRQILPGLAVFVAVSQFYGSALSLWLLALLHLGCFFVVSLVCHGKLSEDRPSPERLTEYFFWISVGGVAGGVFNAIVAPLLFNWSYEYPIAIGLALLLRFVRPKEKSWQAVAWDQTKVLSSVVAVYFVIAVLLGLFGEWISSRETVHALMIIIVLCGIPCVLFARRPVGFAAIIAALPFIFLRMERIRSEEVATYRSFYGVHRVWVDDTMATYFQGTTVHGMQHRAAGQRCSPISYYHRSGPVGQVMEYLHQEPRVRRVAVIGLGTGALACYAKQNQHWSFYEIDPVVQQIAVNRNYFTYLSDCMSENAEFDIVIGDGRLRMQEAADERFELVILDVFSSDAIPIHLVTREAFKMYLRKLAPNGLFLMNVSNRFVNLTPLVANLAIEQGWHAFVANDLEISDDELKAGKMISTWVVVTATEHDVRWFGQHKDWLQVGFDPSVSIWTDERSSILSGIQW
jgi:hypothetical protein